MYFLDIKIDNLTKEEILDKIKFFLSLQRKQFKIFTPNPEMIVDSQNDLYFKEVLNSGDLNICDGRGIELFSKNKIKRMAGVNVMKEILKIAEQDNYSVYFLGSGNEKVIEHLIINLKKDYPKIKISGANKGLKIGSILIEGINKLSLNIEENNDILADIAMADPDILFVAFGHGKQEKWIYEYLKDLPNVKIAMGVGGSFDYLSKKIQRAPKILQKLGFEWLYRFIKEPKRWRRIFKAVIVFPYLAFKNKK